ncbi:torsin-1A-interacting protein 2-like isoform X2 [Sardina pilchardus]|uniref:torsin-1A-interacting protein 2-like isoform X2 n=1 Tax=Sardina pilchardus TaxID=27697 RepID=UPI002E127459
MEAGDSDKTNTDPPSRRVTRQSTKDSGIVLRPREPLKRTRRDAVPPSGAAVNGSEIRDRLPSTDDDEPLKKRRSLQSAEEEDATDNEDDMEVKEDGDEPDSDKDKETSSGALQHDLIRESSVRLIPLKSVPQSTEGVFQLEPPEAAVTLRSRRSIHPTNLNIEPTKHSTGSSKRGSGASLHIPTRPKTDSRTEGQTAQSIQQDIQQYHRKLQDGLPDHVDFARSSRRGMSHNQTSNNIVQNAKLEKKAALTRVLPKGKPSQAKAPSKGAASRICTVILWLFLLCVSLSVAVLGYQRVPWSTLIKRAPSQPASPDPSLDVFSSHMTALQQQFRSQRNEFWRRSGIHLQRHLQTAQPSEPVSLILTGGRGAERTLRCLAAGLASAFSSATNGSVLELDGASLADKDGSQVKLDLDNQLKKAFEGDKPAAVIHRLEELPPSSTLIFYRYCDHENAAYKDPLLAFTVLLPEDAVDPKASLQEVEEMVHSHIHERFLVPDQPDTFDKMDVNKLSGLWSRISHLVLPVNSEEHIEEGGCDRN